MPWAKSWSSARAAPEFLLGLRERRAQRGRRSPLASRRGSTATPARRRSAPARSSRSRRRRWASAASTIRRREAASSSDSRPHLGLEAGVRDRHPRGRGDGLDERRVLEHRLVVDEDGDRLPFVRRSASPPSRPRAQEARPAGLRRRRSAPPPAASSRGRASGRRARARARPAGSACRPACPRSTTRSATTASAQRPRSRSTRSTTARQAITMS